MDRSALMMVAVVVSWYSWRPWLSTHLIHDMNIMGQFLFVNLQVAVASTPVSLQMVVVLGLTLDGGRSTLGRLCRLPPLVVLGQASMAIYLLHRYPLL